jgi:hypothetical protein
MPTLSTPAPTLLCCSSATPPVQQPAWEVPQLTHLPAHRPHPVTGRIAAAAAAAAAVSCLFATFCLSLLLCFEPCHVCCCICKLPPVHAMVKQPAQHMDHVNMVDQTPLLFGNQ